MFTQLHKTNEKVFFSQTFIFMQIIKNIISETTSLMFCIILNTYMARYNTHTRHNIFTFKITVTF